MRPHHPMLPFVAAIAGIGMFSLMDAAIKSASLQVGVYNALLFRSLIGTVLALPLWLALRSALPSRAAVRVHALRSAVVAAMAVLFFWGLVRMPLAEGIALSFIAPLIALYLAALTLGEAVRPEAVMASLLGLAGVVVIALARLGGDDPLGGSAAGIAAVLVSAVLYAWNLVLQRQQAQVSGPLEVALFQNLFVGAFLALAAPWFAVVPQGTALRDIAAGAVFATAALMLLTWGYARAEAQALLPVEYTAFLWAALFGWLWFGERLDAATVAGTALIVAGCWIAARRSRAAAAAAP